MRNRQKGFSLIELLIVVAIILIIAAIAIPNLLRSKMAANEASAVASLRSIFTAQATYNSMYGVHNAATLALLGTPTPGPATNTCTNAGLLDPILTGGTKSGYQFPAGGGGAFTGTTPAICAIPLPAGCACGVENWAVNGDPTTCDTSGHRDFFVDQSGVIRFDASACPTSGLAIATSTALGQ
jgi:prepilin-type N-terminal cleavage/methylation domain-containing protein